LFHHRLQDWQILVVNYLASICTTRWSNKGSFRLTGIGIITCLTIYRYSKACSWAFLSEKCGLQPHWSQVWLAVKKWSAAFVPWRIEFDCHLHQAAKRAPFTSWF
jgi:hypothetical protein